MTLLTPLTFYLDADVDLNVDGFSDVNFGIENESVIDFSSDSYIASTSVADEYPGPYNVIPAVSSQTLSTANKYMTSNVLVEEIPTYLTQNEKGMTFIIGD